MTIDRPLPDDALPQAPNVPAPQPAVREPAEDMGSMAQLAVRDYQQDIELKRKIGTWALIGAAAQIVAADAVFIAYAIANHWDIPPSTIQFWLGAAVVEVIGVLLVIARSLFPAQGKSNAGAEK